MKFPRLSILAIALASSCDAFAPSASFLSKATNGGVKSLHLVPPEALHSTNEFLQNLPNLLLSDETVSAVSDAVAPAASQGSGPFGFLQGPIEALLQIIHGGLTTVGVSEDSWGATIIMMTVLIKLLTYPLTKTQLESTNKMQMLQPVVKDIQGKYQSNPEVMNQKIAEVYQTNEINPLAGCLPAFAQIPIFIGLYRAVLDLAKEDKLNEAFFWLPNLEGPVYGADPSNASDWLFKGWVNGAPALGWDDTAAFLSIPAILIVSQYLSQALMQPQNQDQEQQAQTQLILKILPLMVGWFSLNVPAALGLYWITNNVITTALTLQIRGSLPDIKPVTSSASSAVAAPDIASDWSPVTRREKPTGFGSTPDFGDVKPITPIDAELVEASTEEIAEGESLAAESPGPVKSQKSSKKRGGKKKKK